jgi:thiol-disulfide isomerase/thioredoxin
MSIGATTGLLAGFAAFNLLLSLVLVRRVRPLQKLIEERGIPDQMLPRIGTSVAPFRVQMADGSVVTDEAVRTGTTLIGFFLPHCPSCDRMVARMIEEPPPWPLLAFVEGAPEDPDARAEVEKLAAVGRPGLASAEVERAVGLSDSAAFPTLVRIENGIVTAAGRRLHVVTELAEPGESEETA